jgi:hypothetical protein
VSTGDFVIDIEGTTDSAACITRDNADVPKNATNMRPMDRPAPTPEKNNFEFIYKSLNPRTVIANLLYITVI